MQPVGEPLLTVLASCGLSDVTQQSDHNDSYGYHPLIPPPSLPAPYNDLEIMQLELETRRSPRHINLGGHGGDLQQALLHRSFPCRGSSIPSSHDARCQQVDEAAALYTEASKAFHFGRDDFLAEDARALAKARHRSLSRAGATVCFRA